MTRPSTPPGEASGPTPPGPDAKHPIPTGSAAPVPETALAPPAPPAPPVQPGEPVGRLPASIDRVKAQEQFSPDEPLPAFTFPVLDDAVKQELLQRVEEARARPQSSVERVAAKEAFSPDEPLPAFTFPAIDEATKQKLLQEVEASRAQPSRVPPPPRVPTKRRRASRRLEVAKMLSEFRRACRDAGRRSAKTAKRWIDTACGIIDENRSRLPARVRDALKNVRAGVILAVLAALAFGFPLCGVLLVGARHGEKPTAPPASSAAAPAPSTVEDRVPDEIEQAKKQGTSALEKLTERFPNDPRVWLELAASDSARTDYVAAVAAVGKALAADPKANEQPVASSVLAAAVRKRETADAAFELLRGPMGAPGAAVVYDLSIDPTLRQQLRARAEEWVRSDAFKKAAAPEDIIAGGLRYAKSCSERYDLLPSAAEHGGRRALDYLNIAKSRGGCGRRGRDDCFPCLRKDNALKDAISAIETRLADK